MYIILMAGGVGTRFWPRSRKAMPKQLLNIVGSKSMLQLTFERIKPLTTPDKILIITNIEQKIEIENQLPEIPKDNIIAEPMGRNTAPCIGLAGAIIQAREKSNTTMVVLPADHLISDIENFQQTIKVGADYASENNCLITLGIQPTYPETGYGYIQMDKLIFEKNGKQIFRVKTFAEKPHLETAQRFLESGDFLWNSGMFIWSVDFIMSEIDEYLPELGEDLIKVRKAYATDKFEKVVADVYSRTKSVSIDYGLLEESQNVCVVKSDFSWNDLGSWEAVYNISPKDKYGNVNNCEESILINSKNNYLYSQKKLLAAVDIENLVVVEMNDSILICRKDRSQNVKSVVEYLTRKEMDKFL